jgi:hypothetical protein
MRHGDVVNVRNVRVVIQEGAGWMEYKAPKGKAFVFLLLAVDDIKDPQFKPDDSLRALGWEFKG